MKKIFFLLILFPPFYVLAQTTVAEDALATFAKKYPQERIYVQFDKGEYLSGETIHFKAFIFSGYQLSKISTNIYIELLNKQKVAMYRIMLPVGGGIAEGVVPLQPNMAEDVYYFRAYTSWMLNFDDQYNFIQPLNVYNPSSKTILTDQQVLWNATIHPEGGFLLDNVETKIAVRLIPLGRLPQTWQGYLFEIGDSTKKLAEFNSLNEEIAFFTFTPTHGKQYGVRISDKHNQVGYVSLPAVQKEGATIQAASTPGKLLFRLLAKNLPDRLKGYKILAHIQNELIFSGYIKNDKEEISGSIPIDSSIRGIVQIILFDPMGNAVAERLCFANFNQIRQASSVLHSSSLSPKRRGSSELKITIDTSYYDTYSAQVLNAEIPVLDNNKNILSTFWLGDLLHPPYKAGTYFTKEHTAAAQIVDVLLIAGKGSSLNWSEIMANKYPKLIYPPDNFLTYEGTASLKKRPVAKQQVNMFIHLKDSSQIILERVTDSMGKFLIHNLIFRDTAKIYFELHNTKERINVELRRIQHFRPLSCNLPIPEFLSTTRQVSDAVPLRVREYQTTLNNFTAIDERYKLMEAVVVRSNVRSTKEALNRKLSTVLFRDLNETVFDFVNEEQDIGSGNILDWLQGRVAGLVIQTEENGEQAPYIRNNRAVVYIDEFAADESLMNSVLMSEIAMVKVLKNGFLLGHPAIAIYRKKGRQANVQREPQLLPFSIIQGYPIIEEMKTLKFGDPTADKTENDTRSVLYWNTNLTPEKDKVSIKFFNNDISRRLRVIINGFTSQGVPVYFNQEITIQ